MYTKTEDYIAKLNGTVQLGNQTLPADAPCESLEECERVLSICDVKVHRFVLIYFPEQMISRDICANEGYGTAKTTSRTTGSEATTATVDHITFGAYESDGGM
jgi:hypothetical protein